MDNYSFIAGNKPISIENLKHDSVMKAFERFYTDYFVNQKIDWGSLWGTKDIFFDEVDSRQIPFTTPNYQDCKARYHDGFFNNLTIAWTQELTKGNYRNAIYIWQEALRMARDWEFRKDLHIHKGTPLYFEAVTCLENDEVEVGFALMYEAYLEDLNKNNNDDNFMSPGKAFLEFKVEETTSFYRVELERIKRFFENQYLTPAGLSFQEFKTYFLDNLQTPILIKYQLLLNVFRMFKAERRFAGINHINAMLGLIYLEIIFSVCRLIEPIYRPKVQEGTNKNIFFGLCGPESIFKHVSSTTLGNQGFIKELPNICLKHQIELVGKVHSLTKEERDTLLYYGFRNLSAHELYQDDFINQHIKGILQSIFNVFFKAIK